MLNVAAVTVPVTDGRAHPPVVERTPAGERTTVPGVASTDTFPKFMSAVLAIESGATIVAVAVAVAESEGCANILAVMASIKMESARIFFIFFSFNDDF
jgi:hypothetical protein